MSVCRELNNMCICFKFLLRHINYHNLVIKATDHILSYILEDGNYFRSQWARMAVKATFLSGSSMGKFNMRFTGTQLAHILAHLAHGPFSILQKPHNLHLFSIFFSFLKCELFLSLLNLLQCKLCFYVLVLIFGCKVYGILTLWPRGLNLHWWVCSTGLPRVLLSHSSWLAPFDCSKENTDVSS